MKAAIAENYKQSSGRGFIEACATSYFFESFC